jgi:RimJ/RimL family protein N-acetyltransferase
MSPMKTLPREIRTERLLLRRWLSADLAPFATLNADPKVTEYLPTPLSRQDSDAKVERTTGLTDE